MTNDQPLNCVDLTWNVWPRVFWKLRVLVELDGRLTLEYSKVFKTNMCTLSCWFQWIISFLIDYQQTDWSLIWRVAIAMFSFLKHGIVIQTTYSELRPNSFQIKWRDRRRVREREKRGNSNNNNTRQSICYASILHSIHNAVFVCCFSMLVVVVVVAFQFLYVRGYISISYVCSLLSYCCHR